MHAGSGIQGDVATVGTSAAVLIPAGSGRRTVVIQNLGGSPIYIGGADVTVNNGIEVRGAPFTADIGPSTEIVAVASAENTNVRWAEFSGIPI